MSQRSNDRAPGDEARDADLLILEMVQAWYMDNSGAEHREPHRPPGTVNVPLEDLAKLGGRSALYITTHPDV